MLVLSRKRSEQIVIGSTIRITIIRLEGNQVRLGIEAPGELVVLRAELIKEPAPGTDEGLNPAGRSAP
jgi:carbon storage regulator